MSLDLNTVVAVSKVMLLTAFSILVPVHYVTIVVFKFPHDPASFCHNKT